MAKQKKENVIPETGSTALYWLKKAVAGYVFMMLAVYPLYYQDKYFNMGDAKWICFKYISIVFGVLVFAFFAWYMVAFGIKNELKDYWMKAKTNLTVPDYFVLAYLAASLISSLLTPYKENVLMGYTGWYMGLVAQVSFVCIYLFVSRFWRWDPPLLIVYLVVAFIVFFFGIIMRFGLDPMEMYEGLSEMYVLLFLSTLGQATWYSSYMVLIFPLGMYAFWYYDKKWQRIVFGIFTAAGFMTMCTQNSDSAYVAFAAIFFVMFWKACESNKGIIRFLEILVICFASFKTMGICQILLKDKATKLDALSTFMCQSPVIWLLLAVSIALLVLAIYLDKNNKFDFSKITNIRIVALILVIAAAIAMVVYIYLNTTGKLSPAMSSDNNYFKFDEFWGNNRGSSWMCAVGTFIKEPWIRKIFGAGPDCFAHIVYTYYADVLYAKWGENTILSCAHNEWLNALITLGIVGAVAYIGVFVSCVAHFAKKSKEYPEVFVVCIAIVAYMCHNFFCYQQIICTPEIFILMGGAEALVRFGYGAYAPSDKNKE